MLQAALAGHSHVKVKTDKCDVGEFNRWLTLVTTRTSHASFSRLRWLSGALCRLETQKFTYSTSSYDQTKYESQIDGVVSKFAETDAIGDLNSPDEKSSEGHPHMSVLFVSPFLLLPNTPTSGDTSLIVF